MSKIASAQIRVSSDSQWQTGASPHQQKQDILKRAKEFEVYGEKYSLSEQEIEFIPFHEPATIKIKWEDQPFQSIIDWHKKNPQAKIHLCAKIDRSTRGGGRFWVRFQDMLKDMDVAIVDAEEVIGNKIVNPFAKYGKNYPVFNYDPTEDNQWNEAQAARKYIIKSIGHATMMGMNYLYAGYWFSGAPTGYKHVRVETESYGERLILVNDETNQAKWRIKIYELRAQGNIPDAEIVSTLNSIGFETKRYKKRDPKTRKVIGELGGNPLTEKYMHEILRNPINAGIICNERTNFKAIRGKDFIPLVSIELWNKANRGKHVIVEDGDNVTVIWDRPADFLLTKNKFNPLYAHRDKIRCHIMVNGKECGHPLKGSAPKNKRGIPFPCFHCSYNHKWWSVNKEVFDKVLYNYVSQIKLNEEFKIYFKAYALEEIYKRRVMAIDNSSNYQDRVSELTKQKGNLAKNLGELMKADIINMELINIVQEQYNQIEKDIALAKSARTKSEQTEVNIEKLIKYCYFFIDNLKELLFTEDKPYQNADLFGLLFVGSPSFKELWNGTPQLDPIFTLNESFSKISLEDLVKDKNQQDRTPLFRSVSRLIKELEEPQNTSQKSSVPRVRVELTWPVLQTGALTTLAISAFGGR